VNDLGGVPPIELAVATRSLVAAMQDLVKRDVALVFGPARAMTSLDMKGLSVSALPVDRDLENALLEPVAPRAWPVGKRVEKITPVALSPRMETKAPAPSTDPQRRRALETICETLSSLEGELNALDAKVGDGDTGSTFATAARVLLSELDRLPFADPPALCAAIGARLAKVMGGSSGVLVSIGVSAMAGAVGPDADWASALREGVRRIQQYGGAREGDRTMLDAMLPTVAALEAGGGIAMAAAAAKRGAARTKEMRARAGRSSYVRAEALAGHADPGAVAVAAVFEALA
jgi:dihydroxyacetone kinase